jgi:hypothetical protein
MPGLSGYNKYLACVQKEDLFRVPFTKAEVIRENMKKGNFLPEAESVFKAALRPGILLFLAVLTTR